MTARVQPGAQTPAADPTLSREPPPRTLTRRPPRAALSAGLGVSPAVLAPVLLVVGAAAKLPEVLLPMGTDAGMFADYGAIILRGGRPYVDFWDLHPPLVFYYWAGVQAIAGTNWARTCAGAWGTFAPVPCAGLLAHAIDLLLTVVAALLTYAIGRRVGGSRATAALAAALAVFFANLAVFSVEGNNPTKLTLVPSTLAVWAYLRHRQQGGRGWLVLAGAAVGAAGLAKQPGLLLLAALGAHSWWEMGTGWRPSRAVWWRWAGLIGGAAAVLGGMALYLWQIGSLGGFLDQAWRYNLERLVGGYWHSPEGLQAPSTKVHQVFRDAGAFLFVGAFAGVLAVGLAPTSPVQRLLLFWAAADAVAMLGFREWAQAVPSLALLAAFGIGRLWQAAGRDGLGLGQPAAGRVLLAVLLGSIFSLSMGRQMAVMARDWNDRGREGWPAPSEVLGSWLRKRDEVPAGDLFVWGNEAELYPLSGRQAASRFLNAEALGLASPRARQSRALLLGELQARAPAVIVTGPDSDLPALRLDSFPELRQLLDACYQEVTPFGQLKHDWGLYVRAADRPACAPRTGGTPGPIAKRAGP